MSCQKVRAVRIVRAAFFVVCTTHTACEQPLLASGTLGVWTICTSDYSYPVRVCLKDDGTGEGALAIDCPGKDHRIGTLSKVNNIIYCKNDVLAE